MSSPSSPQISIPAFPGRRTFHLWRREVEDISSRLGPGAYGLLGFLLAPADWLLLANIGQPAGPFAPVPNPGLQPPPVPANVHALWVADLDRFERQVSIVNAFTLALIASLDAPTKQLIAPNGFRGLGLAQILAALVVEYGVATPADITDIRSALQIPFIAGTSFADHVSTHRNAHALLTAHGMAQNAADQVRDLRHSIAHISAFHAALASFDATSPTLALQTFPLLVRTLQTVADTTALDPTAASEGYAAAASTHARPKHPSRQPTRPAARVGFIPCTHHPHSTHTTAECRHPRTPPV